ncbi:caspase family protein [Streptomyces sp. P38-E01]|uniref:Caspase family protein n=2 Tax=Streptomyces tardus TaxID=2780544 RepID=A0A949JAY9_9ACTN|nr:caspase family protein [Streptomyces tardus]
MGTWDYRDFDRVLAVQRSFDRMRSLLLDPVCGPWPEESLVTFENLATLGTAHVKLIEAFLDAKDVAFFYYVGHGIYDHRERLCLTVGDSRIDAPFTAATSLPFEAVRDAFRSSDATVKIAVLDCCSAGLATEEYGRLSATRVPPVAGAYLLMSSSAYEASWHQLEEVADAQTYFTRALVDTVREGIPGAPAGLTLDHLFRVVADRLVEDGRPEPGRRIADHAAGWVFARNNAPVGQPDPGADPADVYREAYRRETEEGVEQLPVIAATYRAAAEAGHAPSMNRLGQIDEGRVQARMQGSEPGPIDGAALLSATQWYTRASEAGDPVGPLHLGQLYEEQYGDGEQALYWNGLAARRGNSAAREQMTGLEQRLRLGIDVSRRPGGRDDADRTAGAATARGSERVRERAGETEAPRAPGTAQKPAAGGRGTVAGIAQEVLHQRWLADWDGSAPLATADCLDVLADACGGAFGEWSTLGEAEGARVLADFLAQLPRRSELARTARRYYEAVGPGNLRAHAARLPDRAGQPQPNHRTRE